MNDNQFMGDGKSAALDKNNDITGAASPPLTSPPVPVSGDPMPGTVSPEKLAANRRNAGKSTGPRTAAGRAVSKMNACKHGILSTQVLVRGLHLRENSREFTALHRRFVAELNPVGPVEEMLVDQIVTTHWRLRRALSAESGEIALSVDEAVRQHWPAPDLRSQWIRWRAEGDPILAMQQSALGNAVLQVHLESVRQAVQRDGELTEATIQNLVHQYGWRTKRVDPGLGAIAPAPRPKPARS